MSKELFNCELASNKKSWPYQYDPMIHGSLAARQGAEAVLDTIGFNSGRQFEKSKIFGSVVQDLNKYQCPSCGSPFFVRGMDSCLQYVQCMKSNCLRVDIIGPDISALFKPASENMK
jgi:hypothetical protein